MKSPAGTRTAVSYVGATPGRRDRVVLSFRGSCQPSSAPTHHVIASGGASTSP
jgi:hypothetical protein